MSEKTEDRETSPSGTPFVCLQNSYVRCLGGRTA